MKKSVPACVPPLQPTRVTLHPHILLYKNCFVLLSNMCIQASSLWFWYPQWSHLNVTASSEITLGLVVSTEDSDVFVSSVGFDDLVGSFNLFIKNNFLL